MPPTKSRSTYRSLVGNPAIAFSYAAWLSGGRSTVSNLGGFKPRIVAALSC
jgi:hypothetical protein